LELLGKRKVTFAETAGIAKVSLWELVDLVKEYKVEWVRFEPEEIEKDLKQTSAARHLLKPLVFNSTPLI
jgi:hypothetical protein